MNDPIIKEIPVYFNAQIDKSLYVLQYPLRPSYRPLEAPVSAKVKPNNHMLHVEIPRDTSTQYFDQDAEGYLKQDKQVLESQWIPPITNYAVGVYTNGELHLNPVQNTYQLRPSFSHIDKAVEEEDMDDNMDDFIVQDEEEKDESKMETKQVEIHVKRRESERAVAARESSYQYKRTNMNAEKWIALDVEQGDVQTLCNEMVSNIENMMTTKDYLEMLQPKGIHDRLKLKTKAMEEEMEDEKSARNMHPKLVNTLRTQKILSLKNLFALDGEWETEEDLLDILSTLAFNVNGSFCLRGHVYLSNEDALVHDAILYLLHQSPTGISRPSITSLLSICSDRIKIILIEVANLHQKERTWTSKEPDVTFATKFPQWFYKFETLWQTRMEEMQIEFPALQS